MQRLLKNITNLDNIKLPNLDLKKDREMIAKLQKFNGDL